MGRTGRRHLPRVVDGHLGWVSCGLVVVVLVVWFAVVRPYLRGRPTDIKDFGALCASGSTPAASAYAGAARYQGPAPHPIVVFPPSAHAGTYPDYADDGTGGPDPSAASVQLVGCARSLGRVPSDPGRTCDYPSGVYLGMFQGRFRIDVYEARTGRAVAAVTIDGSQDESCPALPIPPEGATPGDDNQPADVTTSPDQATYGAKLAPLVTGRAGN